MLTRAFNKDMVWVSINDVLRGKKCDCICPCCKRPLIARQGEENVHHFAHEALECKYAVETELHFRAKEILEDLKEMWLPRLERWLYYGEKATILKEPVLYKFNKIIVEESQGDIKPDLIAYYQDRPLYIEIAVTHFVDKAKLKKLEKNDISCIEINLSKYKNKNISDDELKDILLNGLEHKDWKYNTKLNKEQKRYEAKRKEQLRKDRLKNRVQERKTRKGRVWNVERIRGVSKWDKTYKPVGYGGIKHIKVPKQKCTMDLNYETKVTFLVNKGLKEEGAIEAQAEIRLDLRQEKWIVLSLIRPEGEDDFSLSERGPHTQLEHVINRAFFDKVIQIV